MLLEAAHHQCGYPGRFTPADMGRRAGLSEGQAQRFFRGYHHAWVDRGKLPPEQHIAKVAAAYPGRFSIALLRARLIEDAGLNDASDLDQLEVAANTILQYVRARRREHQQPG